MKFNSIVLLTTSFFMPALGYHEGDKIYAQVNNVDLGHGTTIFQGVKYAFKAPPDNTQDWYISNANGTETPHWKYLPNVKASSTVSTSLGSVPADLVLDSGNASLEKRQRPPTYVNYYNDAHCQDFDAQNRPVTTNQCVYNRGLVSWSSSFTPVGSTCRFIVNYYNSGCGPGSSCSGYITQTLDWTGCFTPPRVFCSTFARCCLSGC